MNTDRIARIEQGIIEDINYVYAIDRDKIQRDTTIESFGGDSLDAVELMMQIENRFGTYIDDEAASNIKTVMDIINLVKSKLA